MARCKHTWSTRVHAERLLDSKGWPNGYYVAAESKHCTVPDCDVFQVRRVPGTRCKSPEEALALYRGITNPETA